MGTPLYSPPWTSPYRYGTSTGETYVYIIPASYILANASKIKILFGSDGGNWRIGEAWIGHPGAGDPYDFDGNQVQVTWSGETSITISESDVWSDILTFSLYSSENLLLAVYIETYNGVPRSSTNLSGVGIYYKTGNDSSTTDKSGYAGPVWANCNIIIREIQEGIVYILSGTIKEEGSPVSRTVRSYTRSTGVLYSSGASYGNGVFSIDAPDNTTEMYVVSLPDGNGGKYNALIFDRVKGVAT